MTFPQRAIGAARLEVPVFEEIEADDTATGQALTIVVLSSLAAGIGLSSGLYNAPVLHRVMLALLLWVFWAVSTYVVGVYVMPEPNTQTTVGELLRTIGFAASPGMLRCRRSPAGPSARAAATAPAPRRPRRSPRGRRR